MTRRSLIAVMAVAGSLIAFLSTAVPVNAQGSSRAWLALGDSYSSGEGIPGTVDVGPAQQHQGRNCQRASGDGTSATAWSVSAYNAVAGDLGFEDMAFVACTGAVTNELASQIGEAQERTGRRKWDVVTLSVGGNDIGFADVLLGCLDANSLPWGAFDLTPGCDVDEPTLRSRVDQLRRSLGSAYDLVASKVTPGGDVVVAGYPHLIEEVARWDRWRRGAIGNCEGIQSYDVGLLRSVTGYLNQQIALAVADADARHQGSGVRFHFLDISLDPYEYSDDPGARHALCSRDPWLNGQTTGVSDGDFRLDRSFHPTQVGHDNTGRVLATFLRGNAVFDDAPDSGGIRDVDLQNTTYPANSCSQDGWASSPPISVANGEGTAGDEYADDDLSQGYAEVYGVTVIGFSDLDEDGREDVVVQIGCSAGGSYGDQIVVPLTLDGRDLTFVGPGNIGAVSTAPEHLGLVDAYGSQRLARIIDATLDGSDILVQESYDATGDECQGCHTGRATIRWSWDGSAWEARVEG